MNLHLLKKSNPLLFTPERYDEYPLDPVELSQFLHNSLERDETIHRDRPFTDVDQLDYLFYLDPKTQELDLDKKIAVEYALFQLQLLRQQGNEEVNDKIASFEELYGDDLKTVDGLKDLLLTLNSVNGLDLDLNKLNLLESYSNHSLTKVNEERNKMKTSQTTDDNKFSQEVVDKADVVDKGKDGEVETAHIKKNNVANNQTDTNIQELISYLFSNTIKKGVELRPRGDINDPTELLKNCLDCLIDKASLNEEHSEVSFTTSRHESGEHENITDDHFSESKYQELERKLAEMTTAFNDLQLAHNFLTKQYENDHNDSLKDMEKLTRTNKELQEKLLSYHSNLAKKEAAETLNSDNNTDLNNSIFRSPSKNFSSPALGHTENWIPQTPSTVDTNTTTNGNMNSPSLSMMKNEFRRLLTETQRKYDTEIKQERQMRKQLQEELNLLK